MQCIYFQFFANNGEPFPISDADDVNIRIEVDAIPITCVMEYIASGNLLNHALITKLVFTSVFTKYVLLLWTELTGVL